MKNQYFGDINDYRKYGLLRALQPFGAGRALVSWMLTPDDGTRDGGRRGYLSEPVRWRGHDPELFEGLATLLASASEPSVALIERSTLLRDTTFHSTQVPDAGFDRALWRQGLFDAAHGKDLVFVDPDNGIEVQSVPMGRRRSSKYVAWEEIRQLWAAGCSVLVYQHVRRQPRQEFANKMIVDLRRHTGARLAETFHTPHVLFLLAIQERHEASVRIAISLLQKRWSGQIDALGFLD